jgi:hypothetical protein
VPEGESPVDVQQAHDEKDTPEDDHPSQEFKDERRNFLFNKEMSTMKIKLVFSSSDRTESAKENV